MKLAAVEARVRTVSKGKTAPHISSFGLMTARRYSCPGGHLGRSPLVRARSEIAAKPKRERLRMDHRSVGFAEHCRFLCRHFAGVRPLQSSVWEAFALPINTSAQAFYGRAGGIRTHDLLTPRHFGLVSGCAVQCRDLRFRTLARPASAAESAQYRLLREHLENTSVCALSLATFHQCTYDRGIGA